MNMNNVKDAGTHAKAEYNEERELDVYSEPYAAFEVAPQYKDRNLGTVAGVIALLLAKKYGDLESGKFVNGILDKINKTKNAAS